MAALNEKPVRLLMLDMIKCMGLKGEKTFTQQEAVSWFKVNYSNIKQGSVAAHLIRHVPYRHQYSPRSDGSDTCSSRWTPQGSA